MNRNTGLLVLILLSALAAFAGGPGGGSTITVPSSASEINGALTTGSNIASTAFTLALDQSRLGGAETNRIGSVASVSATYTLVLADSNTLIQMNTASTTASLVQSILIPASSSVAFPLGTQIAVVRWGVGEVRIAGVSPVVVTSIASPEATPWLLQRRSMTTLLYVGTDTWIIAGHLKDGP